MSDSDSAYGGWCTDWASYTVPQLWEFLQYEGDDLNWDQASAWQKTGELIDYYRSELKQKRDDLAAKWPPARSPAAQVFVQYVDDLLSSMEETSSKAYANSQAVAGITAALADAKRQIGDLNKQWTTYSVKEATNPVVGVAEFLHVGSLVGVPNGWQDTLKAQATKIMYTTDTAVFQHTGQMQVPTEYIIQGRYDKGDPIQPGGSGQPTPGSAGSASGSSRRAPVIPPPPSTPPGPVLAGGGSGTPTLVPPSGGPPFVDTPVGRVLGPGGTLGPDGLLPISTGVSPKGPGVRPILRPGGVPGEGLPSRPPALGRAGIPGPGGVPGEGMPTRAGLPGEGIPGRVGVPGERIPGRASGYGFGEPLPPGESPLRSGMMPMTPMGGVGGRPSASPAPGMTAGRRANPVGGVIGGRGGATYTTQSGHMVTIGPRRSDKDRSENRMSRPVFDPDNPWAVVEGVPPVIEPSPEPQYHDPGPGVIGIDR